MKTHENFQGGDNPVLGGARRQADYWSADLRATSRAIADCEDRLHAVRSGLAAVSGALHVLLSDPAAHTGAYDHLGVALVAELERLQRLVAPTASADTVTAQRLDLDDIVRDVVMSRRLAGQEIAWAPSGAEVVGRADDVVEVLNILLVNAWRHGAGAPARIEVAAEGALVRISVSDDGPGVPVPLRESIFQRGVRRASSPGQGLGLAMARALVAGLGGTLELRESLHGARFDVVLAAAAPAAPGAPRSPRSAA